MTAVRHAPTWARIGVAFAAAFLAYHTPAALAWWGRKIRAAVHRRRARRRIPPRFQQRSHVSLILPPGEDGPGSAIGDAMVIDFREWLAQHSRDGGAA